MEENAIRGEGRNSPKGGKARKILKEGKANKYCPNAVKAETLSQKVNFVPKDRKICAQMMCTSFWATLYHCTSIEEAANIYSSIVLICRFALHLIYLWLTKSRARCILIPLELYISIANNKKKPNAVRFVKLNGTAICSYVQPTKEFSVINKGIKPSLPLFLVAHSQAAHSIRFIVLCVLTN